jgi:hypothetical protein
MSHIFLEAETQLSELAQKKPELDDGAREELNKAVFALISEILRQV